MGGYGRSPTSARPAPSPASPSSESLQPPVQHELRLVLLRRNQANDVFVQPFGDSFVFNIGDESPLVFLLRQDPELCLRSCSLNSPGYMSRGRHQLAARISDRGQLQGLNQVGQHYLLQRSTHNLADDSLVVFDGARPLQVAKPGDVGTAFGQSDRTLDRGNDFCHGNVSRLSRQAVAALDAAMRNQQSTLQKLFQQLADRGQRQP